MMILMLEHSVQLNHMVVILLANLGRTEVNVQFFLSIATVYGSVV